MNNENNIKESLQQAVILLSKAYAFPADTANDDEKKSHFRKFAAEAEDLVKKIPADISAPLAYHSAVLYVLSGDTMPARKILDKIIKGDNFLPEVYWLLIQLDTSNNSDFRWQMEDKLGQLLHLSAWRKLLDSKLEDKEASRLGIPGYDIERPTIPKIDAEKLFDIAKLFEEMNLYQQTANAYREGIYCLAPPRLPDFGADSWIASNVSKYWLAAARSETLIGYRKWAFQATLMAVASSPKILPQALDLLNQPDKPADPAVPPKPDPGKLGQIALYYEECNLHTRALESLRLAEEMLKIDMTGKKRTIAGKWRRLIEEYSSNRTETCFLFGHKVSATPPEQLIPGKFPY